jgi:RHS repeat-associated protein
MVAAARDQRKHILLESNTSDVAQVIYTLEPAGYGNLISQRRSSTTSFYLFDALGSTRKLTSSAAAVTDSYDFKAYGETNGTSGSTVNVYKWVGELGYYLDVDRLAYYLRARPYSPKLARFLAEDPRSLVHTVTYLYSLNSPLTYVDASGEEPRVPGGNIPLPGPHYDRKRLMNCCKGQAACLDQVEELLRILRTCPTKKYGMWPFAKGNRCIAWADECYDKLVKAKLAGRLKDISCSFNIWRYNGCWPTFTHHATLTVRIGTCTVYLDNALYGGSDHIFFEFPNTLLTEEEYEKCKCDEMWHNTGGTMKPPLVGY